MPSEISSRDVHIAGDTMTGQLAFSRVITSDVPTIRDNTTWNNAGVTFTALKVDIINTASSTNSNLIDLQVGGFSNFNVTRAGTMRLLRQNEATNSGLTFVMRKRGNVGDASGAIANGATIGNVTWSGWNGSAFIEGGALTGFAEETWAPGTTGFSWFFQATPVGSTGSVNALEVRGTFVNVPTGIEFRVAGNKQNYNLSVYATGTAYTLTAVSSGVDFGTTDPILQIDKTGTYRISVRVKVNLNAATFAANQTLTVKLRRTNNTAADVANSSTTWTTPVVTTQTNTLAVIDLPEVFYTTALTTDTLQIFADISVVPSAGTITIAEAGIVATRLF